MRESPFAEINKHFTGLAQGSINIPAVAIGKVLSPPPELIVQVGDLQLDKDDIYVADYLLQGYQRHVNIAQAAVTGQTQIGGGPAHLHQMDVVGIADTTVSMLDTLKIGDYVAVLPTEDKQTYIVLCKVVGL